MMNRRMFLASMFAAAGGTMLLRRPLFGQSVPSTTSARPLSAAEQSEAIRVAANSFLQTLAPD
jgi:hypothetical protein